MSPKSLPVLRFSAVAAAGAMLVFAADLAALVLMAAGRDRARR